MSNFLTIQGGDYTVNLNFIAEIDWTAGEEEATVKMASGEEYTFEGDDYHLLREVIGV